MCIKVGFTVKDHDRRCFLVEIIMIYLYINVNNGELWCKKQSKRNDADVGKGILSFQRNKPMFSFDYRLVNR